MSSSTSRFDKRALALFAALLIGSAFSILYTLEINPEVRFWKAAIAEKQQWSQQLHSQNRPLFIFSGGSTTAFAIDSALLLREHDIASANLGGHAGMGLDGTVALATSLVKPGDHLVLMSEPGMLAEGGGELTALGHQVLLSSGLGENAFYQSSLGGHRYTDSLKSSRPGLYHSVTMLSKLAANRPLYRYHSDDILPGGLLTTPLREDFSQERSTVAHHTLSPQAHKFLSELKHWADARNVKLSYSLPVFFVSSDKIVQQREANRAFLNEIESFIPVIRTEYLGALDDPKSFADTGQHLTPEAAERRTRALASNLPKLKN